MQKIPDVKKIAVLRSNAIGDYLVTLPALEAVRHAYPKAEIVLLGQHWQKEFLSGRPGPVNRVEVVPFMKGIYSKPGVLEDPEVIDKFFNRMCGEHFDIALQLYGGGRYSNPFVKNLGARMSAGMKAPGSRSLDRWIPYFTYQCEVHRLLDTVSLIGAHVVGIHSVINVISDDLAAAHQFICSGEYPYVIVHPGASDFRRRWPVEKFAEVADKLSRLGAAIFVTGIETESGLAEELCAIMKRPSINVAGKLTLRALTGLIAEAALVVSNDTGPLHLARAVGTPTVGIYWVGNMINAAPVSMRQNYVHISWRLDCPVCGKNCIYDHCAHDESFVADIDPEDVQVSALELFQKFSHNLSDKRSY